MTVGQRIDLGHARVVSMRELNQLTSAVIDELNRDGKQAVVTKHGLFVALLTPLAGHHIESVVLAEDHQVQELLEAQDTAEAAGNTPRSVSLGYAETMLRD